MQRSEESPEPVSGERVRVQRGGQRRRCVPDPGGPCTLAAHPTVFGHLGVQGGQRALVAGVGGGKESFLRAELDPKT